MALAIDPIAGGELLADLGFLHVAGRPVACGAAYLLVALRPRPTLRHFDPERVEYWTTVAGRGTRAALDRSTAFPAESAYAWGVIRVVDRKGIANEFVSFGGTLRVQRIDGTIFAVFHSPGPIAARGGHSQGWDPWAVEMAGFVGRLRAAAGASKALEGRLASAAPLALYSAFVADAIGRNRDRRGVFVGDERLLRIAMGERRRLSADVPGDWQMGTDLALRLPDRLMDSDEVSAPRFGRQLVPEAGMGDADQRPRSLGDGAAV